MIDSKSPQELLEETHRLLKKQQFDSIIAAQNPPRISLAASYTLTLGETKLTLTKLELVQLRDSINSLLSG